MNVILYSTHCPKCKSIQKTMDLKKISYQIVDDKDLVLQKATEFATNYIPFAIIDGVFFDSNNFKKWVEEYNV